MKFCALRKASFQNFNKIRMPLTKKQKEEILKDVEGKLSKQKSVVFTDFTGLSVAKLQTLRRQLRAKGVDYQVVKKTLLGIALKKSGFDIDTGKFSGSVGVAIGRENEVAPSKIVYDFAKIKENSAMQILGGIFQNVFAPKEMILQLAKIPAREVLLAQLASVLIGPVRALAIALDGVRKQKEA